MPDDPQDPIPDELTQVRALIVETHPDIVPELIIGESIADLVASIATARAAYERVAANAVPPSPLAIPAGGNTPVVLDVEHLPTAEKIRRGLAALTRKA